MRTVRFFFFLIIALTFVARAYSQNCPGLGQNPTAAFPVCGTSTFVQTIVTLCPGSAVPGPCGAGLNDVNPYWYRFKCYVTGTLGFLITPNNLADDYDWQLFDITGHNPTDVYTDASLFVACNWSGFGGITGASSAGTSLINCAGNVPIFSSMPTVIVNHEYVLLVSHFTNTQSGYRLSFTMGSPGGGTSNITDDPANPNPFPEVTGASSNCDGSQITVKLNKKVKCSSLAVNGSDFVLSPSGTIVSASGFGCAAGFDLDSVLLTLSSPLPPGNYTVSAANGSDGNTLLDNCDRQVAVGNNAPFTVNAPTPLPMGTVDPPPCLPTSLTLTFPESLKCNSIATDGSDFIITGPSAITIIAATTLNCDLTGETTTVTIQLSAPILTAGIYTVQMANGTDGNTLIGQCNRQVSAGKTATFNIAAQPPIAMGSVIPPPCIPQSITLTFADPIRCNSVATNGSDFIITGPSAVTISSATAINCNTNGETNTINLQLSAPILVTGAYNVQMANGTDGNTLIGNCGRQTTAGDIAAFTLAPQTALAMGTVTAPNCSPTSIILNFTDNIKCSSIAANGSDFIITGSSAVTISSAAPVNCNANGETNSIALQLSSPIIVSGNYQVQMAAGNDGNTLIGLCNRQTTAGDMASFVIPAASPVPMDSLVPVACFPNSLKLIFSSPIRCSSIAANGSDFSITGPTPVTISSATGNCDATGLTNSIDIRLASPIANGGLYILQLVGGTDGNTLLSDCNRQTPAGVSLSFTTTDTVSAQFQYQVQYDCTTDVITFSHDGQHNVNQWAWTVNGATASDQQTFTQNFSASSRNTIQLTVTNGTCSDTYSTDIVLNNKVTVDFFAPEAICPEDTVTYIDKSTGQIDHWQWNFGNGNVSIAQMPPTQVYPLTGTEALVPVTLEISNNVGCSASVTKTVKVLSGCFIAVPTAFTPNNDGKNDYLYPLNALKAENLDFKVFNRWGQMVFHSRDWQKKWDGKVNGILQATGVYVWTLDFVNKDSKQRYSLKGTTTLIR
jgi:gliding motility-associated-like protein